MSNTNTTNTTNTSNRELVKFNFISLSQVDRLKLLDLDSN